MKEIEILGNNFGNNFEFELTDSLSAVEPDILAINEGSDG